MIQKSMKKTAELFLPFGMAVIKARYRRPLISATHDPDRAQLALLRRILRTNAHTSFGREKCFSEITTWSEYRRNVPVQDYESLRDRIDFQATTASPELTVERPIYFARTSGSTGAPKDIPVTPAVARRARIAQKLTALALFQQTSFFSGDILPLASPSIEGTKGSGCAFGSASGQAYKSLSPLLKPKFILPESVFGIEPYDDKYYVSTLLSLISDRLTGIATANPSTILKLRDVVRYHHDDLKRDLQGKMTQRIRNLGPEIEHLVAKRLSRSQRACLSAELLERFGAEARLADLWPDLSAVLSWTGGSCGVALAEAQRNLPENTCVVELGYRASEMLGSLIIDARQNTCLPALQDTVFEFVERGHWEDGEAQFKTIGELRKGCQYYVFVTTLGGLYRYDMNDVLQVTGWYNKTPVFEFIRKGRGMCSITGEKLCEGQVLEVANAAIAASDEGFSFVALIGDAQAARYDLLVECSKSVSQPRLGQSATEFDQALRRLNLEYNSKRASGRLREVRIVPLASGALEYCLHDAVSKGQRESQYKPLCLSLASDWTTDLSAFRIDGLLA